MPTVKRKSDESDAVSRKKKLWAVIVGVNQYQDETITDLKFCANDAVGLANALQKVATQELQPTGAIFDEVEIFVHSHPTERYSWSEIIPPQQDKILASLGFLSQAKPEDTVLFYSSCHGFYDEAINDTILCLEKTSKSNLAGTGLLITTVLAKITNSPAQQKLVWLDACHSGGVASQLIKAVLRVTENNPSLNLYCITACNRHEQSFEAPDLQHGIFTYHLIKGLNGEASSNLIKADDLYHFVGSQTQDYIKRSNELRRLINHYRLTNHYRIYPSFEPQRWVAGNGEFIIGVSPNLANDNRSRGALVLDGFCPSQTIIDISQNLASQGGFAYQPYPSQSAESLQDSISALLTSSATTTALLYLKGKFETNDDGVWFVFTDGIKISRDWLAKQLTDSPIKQQIIIFDCYQTSEISSYIEPLKQPDISQCILATSTENNWFGQKIIEIINHPQNGLTATNLIYKIQSAFSESNVCSLQQEDYYRSENGILNIILKRGQYLEDVIIDRNYCPYKSLEAFTFNDRDFFFGRDSLIGEILKQLETKHFLLVVGASGSGKSSLVQAGVVSKLLNQKNSEPENACQIWSLRPGEYPIRELANALSQQGLFLELQKFLKDFKENKLSPDHLEGILHLGVDSFVTWLGQQNHNLGILVIDQFEEVFTQTSALERKLFLQLILGAVQSMSGRLKVIVTLRSDFINYCLEIPKLGERVREDSIFIPSYLTEEEYRQIITAPAARVGLAVEPELVNVLVEEVVKEKGALPLLEFTLEQLWKNRVGGTLSVAVYRQKIGGIKQVLQDRANSIYQELTESQKKCAEWIFTQLVSLGEGTKDTRRRRTLRQLIVPKYCSDLVKSTLDKLRDSRLIVMSNQEVDSIANQSGAIRVRGDSEPSEPVTHNLNSKVTVEIAHEILISNWQNLRWWLDTNREHIRLIARIEERAKQSDDFLKGTVLAQAEEFYTNYGDELSDEAQDFIRQSIEKRDKQVKLIKRRRRQVMGGLTVGIIIISIVASIALWQMRRATILEIKAFSVSGQILLELNRELSALIPNLVAAKKAQKNWLLVDSNTRSQVVKNLQNILARIRDFNSLEGHGDIVYDVKFSPDAKMLASASRDGTIKLWNLQGQLIRTIKGQAGKVYEVAFSPDSSIIASAHENGSIKLWNLNGEPIQTLSDHTDDEIKGVSFSPDGKIIASASKDDTVKLWAKKDNNEYEYFKTLEKEHQEFEKEYQGIRKVRFSPDGRTIAAAGYDGNLILWTIEGKHIITLQEQKEGKELRDVVFSPDSQIIVSVGQDHTIKIWDRNGELLKTLTEHKNTVLSVSFSSNGQFFVSGDWDGNIKLWSIDGRNIDDKSLQTFKNEIDNVAIPVFGVSFSPDSTIFASAQRNHIIKLWNINGIKTVEKIDNLDINDLLSLGCNWVQDYLTYNPNINKEERKYLTNCLQGIKK